MENVVIPEMLIYGYLKWYLELIKASIEFSNTESIIDLVFNGVSSIGKYDPIKESKRIFSKEDSIKIKFGMNINPAELPAIHILLPDENIEWESIGWSETELEKDDNTSVSIGDVDFNTAYSLIIVDKNADSVVYIYHILKYMILSTHENLELDGFKTLKISGRDLIQQQGLIPIDVYSRNLSLSFKYNREFVGLRETKFGHSLIPYEPNIVMKANTEDIVVDTALPTEGN